MSEQAKIEEGRDPPGMARGPEALARLEREEAETRRLEAQLDEVEAFRMPLMEHLVELKDRLVKALVALAAGFGVGLMFAREIYDFLTAPFVRALAETPGVEGGLALVGSPFEGINVYFKVAFLAGCVLASPVVSWQVWQFVAPGLYKTERAIVAPLTAGSVGLFGLGAWFCYAFIFPYAFPFFINVLGVDVNLSVDGYLSSVTRMMLAFGLCFQMPIAAFFLARIGLIDGKDLSAGFRYAVPVIFLIAAIITPPDVITQVAIGVPMTLLYGISIVIAHMVSTKVRD